MLQQPPPPLPVLQTNGNQTALNVSKLQRSNRIGYNQNVLQGGANVRYSSRMRLDSVRFENDSLESCTDSSEELPDELITVESSYGMTEDSLDVLVNKGTTFDMDSLEDPNGGLRGSSDPHIYINIDDEENYDFLNCGRSSSSVADARPESVLSRDRMSAYDVVGNQAKLPVKTFQRSSNIRQSKFFLRRSRRNQGDKKNSCDYQSPTVDETFNFESAL